MQAPINKELAALMQLQSAQQAINTLLSSGVAPGTVAAQKVEQTAALTQAPPQLQTAPPSGIERVLPGVGVQAAMSAQAAQPATQGDVNQLRQMMSQMASPQGQGIAAGADVPVAEGGIVGYASRGYVDPQLPEVYEAYNEPSAGESRTGREEEELFGAVKTARQRAIEEATEELLGPMTRARLAAAPPTPVRTPPARPPAAPAPAAQRKPTGIAQTPAPAAPMLPDTRESTAVNPSEAALMYAQMQGGIKDLLERQSKPRERTPEELKEAAAREEEIKRRMGEIDTSKARFEQAKQERLAGQQGQGLRDLAAFLSRAKGPSIFAGLGEATLGMEPVFAARAAQEQRFREQELVFMDKLGERRDLVNDLRLASLKDDAGRAREDAARLRALDMEISKLGLGLGEKRMTELARAEQSREEAAARLKQAREEMRSREGIAQRGLEARTAGRGVIPPKDLAKFRMQAEQQVDKALQEDMAFRRLRNDPTGQAAYREDKIKARVREALLAADYDLPAGYEKAPAPAAGAATRLRFDAQGNPIK